MPVVAFDIDNTLRDPDGSVHRTTVSRFVSQHDLGIDPQEAVAAYEQVRAQGAALERLGLAHPGHEWGHPDGLATLCMTACANPSLRAELAIKATEQDDYRALLAELVAVETAAQSGSFESRLLAERQARALGEDDARAIRFRAEARRIAGQPLITDWARTYDVIEGEQPAGDLRPFVSKLEARGVTPLIITEGRSEIQKEKLDRLGLTDRFVGRVLVSEAAASIPGVGELDDTISQLLGAGAGLLSDADDSELSFLWHYRCLINSWASKTPWFYARCLHAIHQSPGEPESCLPRPVYVSPDAWQRQPLRFVMVGDRYDKDVEPLIRLLGYDAGMTIRLRQGKYEKLEPTGDLPRHLQPHRTFADWDSLARFLTDELTTDQVRPITASPDVVDPSLVRRDYVDRGLQSSLEAVRLVAAAVAEMLK